MTRAPAVTPEERAKRRKDGDDFVRHLLEYQALPPSERRPKRWDLDFEEQQELPLKGAKK